MDRREHHHPHRESEKWPPGPKWDPYERTLQVADEEQVVRELVELQARCQALARRTVAGRREFATDVALAGAALERARDGLVARDRGGARKLAAAVEDAAASAEDALGGRLVRLTGI